MSQRRDRVAARQLGRPSIFEVPALGRRPAENPQRSHVELSPLRHRDFRLLYSRSPCRCSARWSPTSRCRSRCTALTGSVCRSALLGVVELVPLLATAFIGGALADCGGPAPHGDRTEIGLAAGSAALRLNAAHARPPAGRCSWSPAGCRPSSGLQRPSLESLAPRLVDEGRCRRSAALTAFRGSLGMIVGPAVGGMLIASAGLAATYLASTSPDLASSRCCALADERCRRRDGAEAPSLAAIARGLPLRAQPPGADRHLRRRLRRDGLRHAARAVPGARRIGSAGRRRSGSLYAAPAVGALVASVDRALDAARQPPRPRGDARRRRSGASRSSPSASCSTLVAGARLPGDRRRRRRGQRHLPR